MTDFGLKISIPNIDAKTATPSQLAVDSRFPNLKCELAKNPKNYGIVNFSVANMNAGETKQIYWQPHGYTYTPSFINGWNYPIGTNPAVFDGNETYGIGDISVANGLLIYTYVDDENFYISCVNNGFSPVTDINGTIRFFIYADDFPD